MKRRLLVYSQDGMGLGHLRRSTNIVREVLKQEPDSSVLVIADSPAAPFFVPLNGVDYLKLPTIVKTGDTSWQASSIGLQLDEVLKIRSNLIWQAFRSFQPDLVLVDHMPVGALGELKPMLDYAVEQPQPPHLFVGLRDVLDRPEVVRAGWREAGAYDYLPFYEAVLVYASRELHDAESAYELTGHAHQVISCNYVTVEREAELDEQLQDDPFILVMGGGGADFYPLAETFLEAVPALLAETRLRGVILPGPNMPPSDIQRLLNRAAPLPIEIVRGFDDATLWLRKASAVVTMAGYNSLCEVMRFQKKALVVPRSGPSAEQRLRSRMFAERGLIRVLEPESLSPERLARELVALMADDNIPNQASIPALDGASRAAAALLSTSAPS